VTEPTEDKMLVIQMEMLTWHESTKAVIRSLTAASLLPAEIIATKGKDVGSDSSPTDAWRFQGKFLEMNHFSAL